MGVAVYIIAAVSILFIYYWKTVIELVKERIRLIRFIDKIDGPLAIPLFGTTWQFKWNVDELTLQVRSWATEYASQGKSVIKLWIGPQPIVWIIRPEAAKVVLESNTVITKAEEYDILLPWLGTGLLTSTGVKWQSRRKMLTPSFHFKMLTDFLVIHDYQSKILIEQLEPFSNSGEEFDIFPWIKRCALDIICETAMGCTVKAQTNHDHPYVQSVTAMNQLAFQYQRMPWLKLKPLWHLSGFGSNYNYHLNAVLAFTRKVINDKLAEPEGTAEGERKVFLDMLVELSREGKLTYEDIREEVDTFMFEGHDTTSASLGWTLWCLAHHPEYQKQVHEEMEAIFGDSDRDCTNEDLKQMKYLERCIKESLRMRPSVPNFARKVEEDIQIDDFLVPKGCSVVVSPYIIHTNVKVYENPMVYNPDNFKEENLSKRHPYSYIPFSAGPRNCIGQKFAMMEEKCVLSWFFRKYKISANMDFNANLPLPEIIIRPSQGFPVKIEKLVK